MPAVPSAPRIRQWRDRKKRGEHLVTIRITDAEIERLKVRGYAVETGFALAAVVEAFVSDSLASGAGEFG